MNALDRYNKFIRDLEAYPEWKKKVEEEVGNWIHQIHNNIEESKTKRRIFEKMVIFGLMLEQARVLYLMKGDRR